MTWSPSELGVCNGGGSRQSNQASNLYLHFTRKKLPFPTPGSQLKNVTEPLMVLLILVMQHSLFPSLFNYSQTLIYRHLLNIDILLLRTVCLVHWETNFALTFSLNSNCLIRTPHSYGSFLWPLQCPY